jgi:hypothetical protein
MKRLFLYSIILIVPVTLSPGCDNEALFDQLKSSSLSMVIKGTYESDSPRTWLSTVIDDDNMAILPPDGIDSSTKPSGYDSLPTAAMIDIAEIKINGERFANYRKVIVGDISSSSTDPFFNGTGLPFSCDDIRYKRDYTYLNVYVRKTMFNNAHRFIASTGVYSSIVKSLFNEVYTPGYNFILKEVWSVYDNLRSERSDLNRIYPLSISFDTPLYCTNDDQYFIEVRLVVKNFIKRYEIVSTEDSVTYSYHYFGFSDWARDALPGDEYSGGNLFGVARWYSKKKATTVTGSIPSVGGSGAYVIAIPAEDTIDEYTLSSSDRVRPSDMLLPRNAPSGGSDIIPAMEYLVDLQKYNGDYAKYYASLTSDFSVYSDAWTNYDSKISSLKIPPLAVFTSDGTFTMNNVQSGRSYKFYYADAAGVGMGELPSSFTGSGTVVEIDTGYAGGTFTVPSSAF